MIGPGLNGHTFDYGTITQYVPNQSGVYAIYNQQRWIYVGEGGDIRARLECSLTYGVTTPVFLTLIRVDFSLNW